MDLNLDKIMKDAPAPKVAIEKQPQIIGEVLSLLNQQIINELYSSQLYYSISALADDKGYTNMSELFQKYAKEELTHMDKIYSYVFDRNSRAITGQPNVTPIEYKSIRDVYEFTLNHEIGVTKNWNNISIAAEKSGDHNTHFFSQWFINEQVEEEVKARDILFLLNTGTPEWYLEAVIFKSML
jgi:ferritin